MSDQTQIASVQRSPKRSAEDFINIAELRLKLYETITASAPGNLDDFAGFLTAHSSIHHEATPELLKARNQ
jgi:hypothetical protein